MLAALFIIVHRGSAMIASQRGELRRFVVEAQTMAAVNHNLRLEADQARLDASAANEQLLARIGSDLHDGPAQLLSLVVLRLSSGFDDGVWPSPTTSKSLWNFARGPRRAAQYFCRPEPARNRQHKLAEALRLAVFRHEDLTGSKIALALDQLPNDVPDAVKTCAYRVIQEGLTNASKHAAGADISVMATATEADLLIEVSNTGGSLRSSDLIRVGEGKLGLAGMRNRVGALGGTLEITANTDRGITVRVTLPLSRAQS